MNCFFRSRKDPFLIYESAQDDCDKEFMVLWKKFLNGECPSWKELVADGVTRKRPPSVYFHDIFMEMIHNNLLTQCPEIAEELNNRNFKCTSRILVSIMKFTLDNVLIEQEDQEESIGKNEKAKKMEAKSQYINKIARHHCKWHVKDSSYITIENALMESLRICLGTDFTATFEVRMRYKYGQVKNLLRSRQGKFEQSCPFEASKLREEGKIRIGEIQKILASREHEPRSTLVLEAQKHGKRMNSERSLCASSSRWSVVLRQSQTLNGTPSRTMTSLNSPEPFKEATHHGTTGALAHVPPSDNQRSFAQDAISDASESSTCSTLSN